MFYICIKIGRVRSILICIFFGMFSALSAQTGTVSGRLTDGKESIAFAAIGLRNTTYSTITDKNGDFSLKDIPYGSYELIASMVGYNQLKKKLVIDKAEATLSLVIIASENRLAEVVVSGTMKEVSKADSPIPVEILTPALFHKNPTPSLFESMQMVNGVQPQLNCNVCNTGDIHINGMEGPYTMITIDGMPIVSSLSTVYGLSGIPNSLVNRIEVVKGPASTLYGSEAVGGLINVITKDPYSSPAISADIMATTDQEYNVDLGFKLKAGKAQGLLGINYFNFQNRIDRNNDNFTDVTLQHRISLFNKWRFERKDDRVASLAARFVYEDRFGGEMQWKPEWRGSDSVYGESIFTTRYELIGLYQLPLKEKIFLQYSFNTHMQNSYYGTTPYMADQTIAFGQLYWTRTFKEKTDIIVGVPFRYTYYDDNTPATAGQDTLLAENKPQQTSLPGIFVQGEHRFKKLTTLAGIRYDHNTTHGEIFSPRVALKYAAGANDIFRLSGGNGYRVVNLFTEDHAALTGAREVVVKNNLEPERSWNANLNYIHYITKSKGYATIDASIFYTYFTNKINGDFATDPNKIIFDNLDGHAISQGISLTLDLGHVSGVKLILGATYMNVYSIEKDSAGDYRKKTQLYAPDLSGNFTLSIPVARTGIMLDYTGNVKSPMHLPVVPYDYRPEQSPWFTIQNVQLSKKFGNGLEIYTGVKNVFDFIPADPILRPFDPFDKHTGENNPYNYSFDPSYNYSSMQGRRFFLGVRYNLFN
jgi:outer membrane receptor for ferrienterochelin and colicins